MNGLYMSMVDGRIRSKRAPKESTINDNDREGFVENDEGWYLEHKRSKMSLRNFVRSRRGEIDAAMRKGGY